MLPVIPAYFESSIKSDSLTEDIMYHPKYGLHLLKTILMYFFDI